MKVTYIEHSCFVVEIEDCILVFDYYKGKLPEFSKDKKMIFFVSHHHSDHFNTKIYSYSEVSPHVTYVLSKDVKQCLSFRVRLGDGGEKTIFVDKDQDLFLNVDTREIKGIREEGPWMHLRTLRSTDEGVAFVIEYAGKHLYFAGDLHWWSWDGESKEDYIRRKEEYGHEMDKISGEHFDAAFVVLDPRLGENYWWGMKKFIQTTRSDYIFPMHFWGSYQLIHEYQQLHVESNEYGKIMEISKPEEKFILA